VKTKIKDSMPTVIMNKKDIEDLKRIGFIEFVGTYGNRLRIEYNAGDGS
jgi:hypothetical protein